MIAPKMIMAAASTGLTKRRAPGSSCSAATPPAAKEHRVDRGEVIMFAVKNDEDRQSNQVGKAKQPITPSPRDATSSQSNPPSHNGSVAGFMISIC